MFEIGDKVVILCTGAGVISDIDKKSCWEKSENTIL